LSLYGLTFLTLHYVQLFVSNGNPSSSENVMFHILDNNYVTATLSLQKEAWNEGESEI